MLRRNEEKDFAKNFGSNILQKSCVIKSHYANFALISQKKVGWRECYTHTHTHTHTRLLWHAQTEKQRDKRKDLKQNVMHTLIKEGQKEWGQRERE